jgi:CYTH domain-containing protein
MRTGSTVVYKLGQKVRHDPHRPSYAHLTNMYLTETEFEFMEQLEGTELIKTRWQWIVGDTTLSVDQFAGSLDGLVLAELELALDDTALRPPPLAVADVTEDDRFSGGRLAILNPAEASVLLEAVARMTAPHTNL